MSTTRDGRFFVKTLKEQDARSLLDEVFLRAYVARATTGQSLMTKIFAVFKYPSLGTFVAMSNCLSPKVKTWSRLYDLKGTADDKTLVRDGLSVPHAHKRFYQLNLIVRECFGCYRDVPVPRQRYIKGKHEAFDIPIFLTPEQRKEILTALKNDVALFEAHNLMDYSLLIGIQRVRREDVAEAVNMVEDDVHNKPYVVEYGGEVLIMYFGVIDFLQSWNTGKKVAHVVKLLFAPRPISTVNPKAYAKQFLEHFEYKLKGVGFDVSTSESSAERASLRRKPGASGVAANNSGRSSPSMMQRLRSSVSNVTATVAAQEE